eukprot:6198416-Pleurochrysis_carterae.AAC.2
MAEASERVRRQVSERRAALLRERRAHHGHGGAGEGEADGACVAEDAALSKAVRVISQEEGILKLEGTDPSSHDSGASPSGAKLTALLYMDALKASSESSPRAERRFSPARLQWAKSPARDCTVRCRRLASCFPVTCVMKRWGFVALDVRCGPSFFCAACRDGARVRGEPGEAPPSLRTLARERGAGATPLPSGTSHAAHACLLSGPGGSAPVDPVLPYHALVELRERLRARVAAKVAEMVRCARGGVGAYEDAPCHSCLCSFSLAR